MASTFPESVASRGSSPVSIDAGALEHLRYIRDTIEAAHTFTSVPGKGCIAMGLTALVAAGLDQARLFLGQGGRAEKERGARVYFAVK